MYNYAKLFCEFSEKQSPIISIGLKLRDKARSVRRKQRLDGSQ